MTLVNQFADNLKKNKCNLLLNIFISSLASNVITNDDQWQQFSNDIKEWYLNGLIILKIQWDRQIGVKNHVHKVSKKELKQERLLVEKIKSFCQEIQLNMMNQQCQKALKTRLQSNSMCKHDQTIANAFVCEIDLYGLGYFHYWEMNIANAIPINRHQFRSLDR